MKPNKYNFENDSKNLITWEGTSLLCNYQAKTLAANTNSISLFQRLNSFRRNQDTDGLQDKFSCFNQTFQFICFCGIRQELKH